MRHPAEGRGLHVVCVEHSTGMFPLLEDEMLVICISFLELGDIFLSLSPSLSFW